jgi:hypothetical protein
MGWAALVAAVVIAVAVIVLLLSVPLDDEKTPQPEQSEPAPLDTSVEARARRVARKLSLELCNGWGQAYGEECAERIRVVVLAELKAVEATKEAR